jgi:hypothetical protein
MAKYKSPHATRGTRSPEAFSHIHLPNPGSGIVFAGIVISSISNVKRIPFVPSRGPLRAGI